MEVYARWPGRIALFTAQEFKTLKFMLQNAERVISRDELLNEVWGYQNYPSTRTVDNHILKLRQKVGRRTPTNPVHFPDGPRYGLQVCALISKDACDKNAFATKARPAAVEIRSC